MSPTIPRAILSRVSGHVVCGLALASMAACHHRSSVLAGSSPADKVNVGYGERSKEQIGGAVQSLVLDSNSIKATHVEELLIGRFPGVHVRRTASGGFSVRIRGESTFISNEEPLYVVDGLPVHVTPGRGLDWLNPAEVARIDVLKNPAETSMYGVRGAKGVILITTKRRR